MIERILAGTAVALCLLYIVVVVGIAVGWVINLVELFQAQAFTLVEGFRLLGVVLPPLGAMMGYCF